MTLTIDGHVETKVLRCTRLDIGPTGSLRCDNVEVRHQTEITGSLDAEKLVTKALHVSGKLNVKRAEAKQLCATHVTSGHIKVIEGAVLNGDFTITGGS